MPSKVALNYFKSSEFLNTVQLLGVMSIPYILDLSQRGFKLETMLNWFFVGFLGVLVKGRKDLQANPNLYTNKGILGTDPEVAKAYVAQNIAVEQATASVIGNAANERINEVANDILDATSIPDLLKPYTKKAGSDFLRGLFK